MSLSEYWSLLVGVAPSGFEFLPYLLASIFLYMVCRFIFEFFVFIFSIVFKNFS